MRSAPRPRARALGTTIGAALGVALLSLLALGCAHAGAASCPGQSAALMRRYRAAIVDAAVYNPGELRPLHPLRFDPVTHEATVVALTDHPYTVGEQRMPVYLWVTGVPEIQERCRRFPGDPALRLRELLGLPPQRPFTVFAVMTVHEGDVFRPTPDPDPTTAQLCPESAAGCPTRFPADADPAHVRWIADQLLASYARSPEPCGTPGYPWTHLGYTYDWAPGADPYGVSEYVIRKGSTVHVTAVVPYRDYCRAGR